MARLAKSRITAEVEAAALWDGILAYVNNESKPAAFQRLAMKSFAKMGAVNAKEVLRKCRDVKEEADLCVLMDRYRDGLRNVLHWITAPVSFSVMDRSSEARLARDVNAFDFLQEHSDAAHLTMLMTLTMDTKSWTAQSFFTRKVGKSDSVLAGVCHFILNQMNRHDVDGEERAKLFPFKLCGRKGCERFFYVQRAGKAVYCSTRCRVRVNDAKKTKEEKRAKQAQYRAVTKKMSNTPLRVAKKKL